MPEELRSLWAFRLTDEEVRRIVRWGALLQHEHPGDFYPEDEALLEKLDPENSPNDCECGLPQGNHRC